MLIVFLILTYASAVEHIDVTIETISGDIFFKGELDANTQIACLKNQVGINGLSRLLLGNQELPSIGTLRDYTNEDEILLTLIQQKLAFVFQRFWGGNKAISLFMMVRRFEVDLEDPNITWREFVRKVKHAFSEAYLAAFSALTDTEEKALFQSASMINQETNPQDEPMSGQNGQLSESDKTRLSEAGYIRTYAPRTNPLTFVDDVLLDDIINVWTAFGEGEILEITCCDNQCHCVFQKE